MLKKFEFQPGLDKNDTQYGSEGKWIDGDKIRFRNGKPQKLGGWSIVTTGECPDTFRGVPRTLHSWSDNTGTPYLGIGTKDGVFVYDLDCVHDVTPCTSTVATSVFTVSNGALYFTVSGSDLPVDSGIGDWVDIQASVSVGGQSLFGAYQIVSVGTNKLELTVSAPFTGPETANTSANMCFFVGSGLDVTSFSQTYGAGDYGEGDYGIGTSADTAESRADKSIRLWFLDNWGQDLLALQRGGSLHSWSPVEDGLSADLSVVPNAPIENFAFFITQPRPHVVMLGTNAQVGDYDPMLVRWSKDGDFTEWEASTGNTAGEIPLQAGSYLVGGLTTRRENLIFSDTALFSMRELNNDPYFDIDQMGEQCGLVGPNAVAAINDVVYWMSYGTFYKYDGVVSPLACSLQEAVFEVKSDISLNQLQREKVVCGTNTQFNEIWWFYPSRDSDENDRYIVYNYVSRLWFDGSLSRTAWLDADVLKEPYAATVSTDLYQHEQGKNDNGTPMYSWIKSSQFDIEDGENMMFINEMVPDFEQTGDIRFSILTYPYPYVSPTTKGPYTVTNNTRHVNLRARGRQSQILLESSTLNGDWELGTLRMNIKTDGKR